MAPNYRHCFPVDPCAFSGLSLMARQRRVGAGLVHPVAVVRQPGKRAGRGRVKPHGFRGLTRTGRSARLTGGRRRAAGGARPWGFPPSRSPRPRRRHGCHPVAPSPRGGAATRWPACPARLGGRSCGRHGCRCSGTGRLPVTGTGFLRQCRCFRQHSPAAAGAARREPGFPAAAGSGDGVRGERAGTGAGTGVRQVLAGHGKYSPGVMGGPGAAVRWAGRCGFSVGGAGSG